MLTADGSCDQYPEQRYLLDKIPVSVSMQQCCAVLLSLG
jgi:hypothetical protein